MKGNDSFPYFDSEITFSDNLPEPLKKRLAMLKDAWERKDIIDFMYFADCLEPLMKKSYFLHLVTKEELEKFYIMLGRDWWNRSARLLKLKQKKKDRLLASFSSHSQSPGDWRKNQSPL